MLDSLELGITDLGKGGWHGVGERVGESASGADGGVGRGDVRYRTIVGRKFNSVDDLVRSGFWDVYSVAPIVFRGADDVPTDDAMGCPGVANTGDLKDENFSAGRSKGRAIEIKGSIEPGFSR